MNDTLPKNIDAERAIFSIILLHQDKFIEVSDYLVSEDFYLSTHQDIWKAMKSLFDEGQDLDLVSIKGELSKLNIDAKPAIADLVTSYEEESIETNISHFAKEVKNKSLLRKIIKTETSRVNQARLDDAQAISVLGEIEKDVVNISDLVKDSKAVDSSGIIDEINIDLAKETIESFDTGFKWLDQQTGGLIPTQSWIVGAYTGIGKTFFLLQMLLNVLRSGAKVMLFSTEMDRKINMLRLIGNLAGVGTIKLIKNQLEESEKDKVHDAEKVLKEFKDNLIIYDNVYTLEEIRLKAKKKKLKSGLDVVFIDFIQNLRGPENIYERMSNAAISLQQLAQELNLTMIIASQVAQTSAGWSSKEAIEYKGAGEIAAIADVGLWIKRVESDKNARQIIIRKIRHGVPGHFLVRISFPSGRVIDMEEVKEDDDVKEQIDDDF